MKKREKTIGIVYASTDGQTLKICKHVAEHLQKRNIKAELIPIRKFDGELKPYDTIVFGACVRYGFHNLMINRYVRRKRAELKKIKTVFFSVNLVARKPHKSSPSTNPSMKRFIRRANWIPDHIEVFAGKLDYQSYNFIDTLLIKFIMKMTKGPLHTDAPIEYTDWNQVEEFADKVSTL